MEIGLDIGTGFAKISANGKTVSFPSLYSSMFSDKKSIYDVGGKDSLEERVGFEALHMSKNRKANTIRPVKHGMPNHDKGFLALIKKAVSAVGIIDLSDSTICIGITFDSKDGRKRIEKLVKSLRPRSCVVVPQAYGTLVHMGKKSGTVVNVGHGTTEIITITPGSIDGSSIPKGGEFVMSQLDNSRGGYVNFEKLFAKNPEKTAVLVRLLADHIADEVSRVITDKTDEIILAGGGSLIPGMKDSLTKATGLNVILPESPVFSNALGLEMVAVKSAKKSNSVPGGFARPGTDTQKTV